MLQINYSKDAQKFLNRQNASTRKRILIAIEKLPLGDVKKLQGTNSYRLRVGDFRILFEKYTDVINIIEIGNRGQIYRLMEDSLWYL